MFEKPLLPNHIVDGIMKPIEKLDGRVKKISMSHADYPDLRKFGRDVLDFVTAKELLKTGYQAKMYGIELYTDKTLQEGEFKVAIDKNGQEDQVSWCMSCQKPVEGPFCPNPDCIVAHVHDS